MTPEARATLEALGRLLRPASIGEVGGFRPPTDPRASWFGRAVGRPGEDPPVWKTEPLLPLLQINVTELPVVPAALAGVAVLVLYHNGREHPFERPHGEGWAIREYRSTDDLEPLAVTAEVANVKPFPIRWRAVEDDAPSWDDAWELLDLDPVNDDEEACEAFHGLFTTHHETKVGGYPRTIQSEVGAADFVFQVASEPKANWGWVDDGIAYFHKDATGTWRWSCQFY